MNPSLASAITKALGEGATVLRKPFDMDALARTLSGAAGQAASGSVGA